MIGGSFGAGRNEKLADVSAPTAQGSNSGAARSRVDAVGTPAARPPAPPLELPADRPSRTLQSFTAFFRMKSSTFAGSGPM
jgi:hypothetical protein